MSKRRRYESDSVPSKRLCSRASTDEEWDTSESSSESNESYFSDSDSDQNWTSSEHSVLEENSTFEPRTENLEHGGESSHFAIPYADSECNVSVNSNDELLRPSTFDDDIDRHVNTEGSISSDCRSVPDGDDVASDSDSSFNVDASVAEHLEVTSIQDDCGNSGDNDIAEGVRSFSDASDNESVDTDSDTRSRTSSDDESVDYREVYEARGRKALYDGAPVTVEESLISILTFSLRHKITKALLSDTLRLIELHCPPGNNCKKTVYSFDKFFSGNQTALKRHHFCSVCFRDVESANALCNICGEESTTRYFIEVPIINQVQALYKRPGFHTMLQHRTNRVRRDENCYEDIYDGAVYQELNHEGCFLSNPNNISLTWYADGIQVYKSSKFSIWVVYLQINELPLSERTKKENIILVGLWFGEDKPIANLFLDPARVSLMELREGVDVEVHDLDSEIIHLQGIVICGTCDLPAKAIFMNMVQYNGKYGCQKCKQRGVYLREDRVFVYPFEPFTLRTDEETRAQAREACGRAPIFGVKGPTVMNSIVPENIRALAVDVMHCVFEGVVKKLMKIWFDTASSDHAASIVDRLDLIDERIALLTPPSSVQRLPRSIQKHFSYWKAHEFKVWFFYYSIPCLNDIMSTRYFNNYKLLVLGISLLCKDCISPHELELASRALIEFVSMFEIYYYRKNMTQNVHQLLHLVETVRQFGPLWTTTCFPFEDLNGQLVRLIHGSNAAQLQVHHAVSLYMNLATLKNEHLIPGRPATDFCESLDYKRGRMKRFFIEDSVYIVGCYSKMVVVPVEMQRMFQQKKYCSFFYYQRLLKRKILYSSTEYMRVTKTNSTYAAYSCQDNSAQIGQIRCFVRATKCFCHELCNCEAENYAILRPCLLDTPFSTVIENTALSSIHKIRGYEGFELSINICNLTSVCFYGKIKEEHTFNEYVTEPVNLMESE